VGSLFCGLSSIFCHIRLLIRQHKEGKIEYSQINEHMWLGSMPTTADDYMHLIENFDRTIEFNHAEDLSSKHQQKAFAGNPDAWKKYNLAREHSEIKCLYFPINDGVFRGAVEVYQRAYEIYKKDRITDRELRWYVHCHNGKHRSAHFYIYMLMLGGMDYSEAFKWLHSKRPVVEEKPPLKAQLTDYFMEGPA
jgi:hypothetical protein